MSATVEPASGHQTSFAVVLALSFTFCAAAVVVALVPLVLTSRHERNVRTGQAAILAQDLASRIAACSDPDRSDLPGRRPRTLPPSSRSVPAVVPGREGYRSTPADWQDEAFRCADFQPRVPVPGQIQWVTVPPMKGFEHSGEVRVSIDLDDDGVPDDVVVTEVACSAAQCTVAPNATRESFR